MKWQIVVLVEMFSNPEQNPKKGIIKKSFKNILCMNYISKVIMVSLRKDYTKLWINTKLFKGLSKHLNFRLKCKVKSRERPAHEIDKQTEIDEHVGNVQTHETHFNSQNLNFCPRVSLTLSSQNNVCLARKRPHWLLSKRGNSEMLQ